MRILKPSGKRSGTTNGKPDGESPSYSASNPSLKSPDRREQSGDLFDSVPDVVAGKASLPARAEAKSAFDKLFASGVRLLAMREHSEQELRHKLARKTEDMDLVLAVIDELIDNNYQSDLRYTESYVRSRSNRGYGPIRIRNELRNKGIKTNMIEEFLNVNSAIWFENARNQYQKKYGDAPVTDYNAWSKRARFMQSRGFSMEHIQVTLPALD